MSPQEKFRDCAAERADLEAIGVHSAFIETVQSRLDAHGAKIAQRGLGEVLEEISEEAADIAAWAIVARAQAGGQDRRVTDLLDTVTRLGAAVHEALDRGATS